MYDSLLFGNGLTKAVLASIKNNYPCKFSHYLDCDAFIHDFINAEHHPEIFIVHKEDRDYIQKHFGKIVLYGFERWVSENIFSTDNEFKNAKFILYILYNYWYDLINEAILKLPIPTNIITQIGETVLKSLHKGAKIFTTNFDTLLDSVLHPDHIHGTFQLPLPDLNDTVAFNVNEQEFEWKYLFGTNGLEKLSRLDRIKKTQAEEYDIDFFYDNTIDLGNLLIYGLSFGRAEFISDEFLRQYPQHKDVTLVRTVDGHILLKLSQKRELNKLKRITISYYKESEIDHYKEMFEDTNLEDIVEYLPSHEMFDF